MLIAGRNSMMAGERLPFGAKRVEYLEANGDRTITTSLIPTNVDVYKSTFYVYYGANAKGLFSSQYGVWNAANGWNYYLLYKITTGKGNLLLFQLWTFSALKDYVGNLTAGKYYTEVNLAERKFLLRGSMDYNVSIPYVGSPHQDQPPLTVFGGVPLRIYDFIVERNGSVVLDLIPVRIGSIGYMYDKVSKTMYAGDGTGSFIIGPDVAGGGVSANV